MNIVLRKVPYWGGLALLIYMPFHVLLSQSLSLMSGNLNAWKIAKDVFTLALLLLSTALVFYFKKAGEFYKKIFLLSALYFLLHLVIFKLNGGVPWQVSALATVYNNRLVWYLLIGLSISALTPKLNHTKIIKITLIISSVVCLLGIAQYFLPQDLLTHIGYSVQRGVEPSFLIDQKPDLPRIFSTLREPNSLGAFLILPITLLIAQLFRRKPRPSSSFYLLSSALAIHLLALLLTFSRSAWLGTLLSVAFLLFVQKRNVIVPFLKRYSLLLVTCTLILAAGIYAGRDQYLIQNALFHSDENSAIQLDSNEKHISFARAGLNGILNQPFGHGPGTAGPVSMHLPENTMPTENYFIQIAYEVGLAGLAVFIALNILVIKLLTTHSSLLTASLLASWWGLLLCNLLLAAWSNEAVALQWWLLAGLSAKPK